jgi:hypothetical protein
MARTSPNAGSHRTLRARGHTGNSAGCNAGRRLSSGHGAPFDSEILRMEDPGAQGRETGRPFACRDVETGEVRHPPPYRENASTFGCTSCSKSWYRMRNSSVCVPALNAMYSSLVNRSAT